MKRLTIWLAAITALLLISPGRRNPEKTRPYMYGDTLRCLICPERRQGGEMALGAGYNYELLRRFEQRSGCRLVIGFHRGPSSLDSLLRDSCDILVGTWPDSCTHCLPLADGSSWAAADPNLSMTLNQWLGHFLSTDASTELKERFTPAYSPTKRAATGLKYKTLSPYDALIRDGAKKIGWDWHLLAALIWTESHFKIEVQSPRRATGLMQLRVPSASEEELIDPAYSIERGTDYLLRLQKMFSDYVAGAEDVLKFTLAAYNAGEKKVLDCQRYAQEKQLSHLHWDSMVRLSGEREDDENGKFLSGETLRYVENILQLQQTMRELVP